MILTIVLNGIFQKTNVIIIQIVSFVCFLFDLSTLGHTSRLMLGSAIPDGKYNSSILVGLRHPVIARHALLS